MVPTHEWLNEVEWYGWTADGQLFDAALNRGEPAVEVQQSTVPKGFWEGADKPNWSIQGRFVPQVCDWISVSKVFRSDVFFLLHLFNCVHTAVFLLALGVKIVVIF